MTAQNDFVPFATGAGANALTPSAFRALTAIVGQGVQAGLARSDVANTVWRQASFVAAMIGEFIKDAGYDALDNGDLDGLEANFIAALRHTLLSQETALLHFGVDTGTANHVVLATPSPAVTALADGMTFLFRPNATNTGATDFVCGILPSVPMKRDDGATALGKGDLVAGRLAMAVYYSGKLMLVCQVPDVAMWHQGTATGGTSTAMTTTLSPLVGVLVPHIKMRVPITTANGAAPTMDFGFGAFPIVSNITGAALAGGEMAGASTGYEADLHFDGTSLRLMNPLAGATPAYTGATDSVAGAAGIVPAPPIGSQRKVPLGSGVWGDLPLMVGASSGAGGKLGAVAAPAAGDQLKFWRGDGVWADAGDMWGLGIGAIAIVPVTYMTNNTGLNNPVGGTATGSQMNSGFFTFGSVTGVSVGTSVPLGNFGVVAHYNAGEWSDSRKGSFAGTWTCQAFCALGDFGGATSPTGVLSGFMVMKRTL